MRPHVTVLMSVRNGGTFLRAAIDSIARQSLDAFEFVIVDDGSTDSTLAILEQASRNDRRIRVITGGTEGIAAALETGRAVARGAYIARMDGDDVSLPRRLAAQAAYLDAHPDVVAVGGQVRIIDGSGKMHSRGLFPATPAACRAYLAFGAPFCHPAVMMRGDALRQVGGYRRRFEPAEDFDLWLRLSAVGNLANLDEEILQYRMHPGTVTRRRSRANARAACLARLAHIYGETILPCNWQQFQSGDAEWLAVEAVLPPQLRLEARGAYLRALTLNSGITEPDAWPFFVNALPEIARHSQIVGQTDMLAFMIVRAAYQLARSGAPFRGLFILCLGMRYAPGVTLRESLASVRARLGAGQVHRAGTPRIQPALDAPATGAGPGP